MQWLERKTDPSRFEGSKMVILLDTKNLFDVEGMQSFDHVTIDPSSNHSPSQEETSA